MALSLSADGPGRRGRLAQLDRVQFGEVRVWDTTTGKEVASFDVPAAPVYSVALSRDGRLLAAGLDNDIRLWALPSRARSACCAATNRGSRALGVRDRRPGGCASGGLDRTARLWDVLSQDTGRLL